MKEQKAVELKAKKEAEKTEEEQTGEMWEHDFGKGTEMYERYPNDDEEGTYYIFHPTKGFLGLYHEDADYLDTTVPNPTE